MKMWNLVEDIEELFLSISCENSIGVKFKILFILKRHILKFEIMWCPRSD